MPTVEPHVAYINYLEKTDRIRSSIQAMKNKINSLVGKRKPTPEEVAIVRQFVREATDQMRRAQDEYIKEIEQ